MEEVLFESERTSSREEIATYLRNVADSLESGGPLTLSAGGESTTVEPPARPTFEVKVEREGPPNGPTEIGLEFELEWDENSDGGDGNGELQIE